MSTPPPPPQEKVSRTKSLRINGVLKIRGEDPKLLSSDPNPLSWGKIDFINHNCKLEFVDSGLYFVNNDENNFKYPLLQVGSGSKTGSDEKSLESGWPKINGSDRIRILVPA